MSLMSLMSLTVIIPVMSLMSLIVVMPIMSLIVIISLILIYIYVLSGRSQDLHQRAILLVTLKLRLMLRRELQRQR